MIDASPITSDQSTIAAMAASYTSATLWAATNQHVDELVALIGDQTDAQAAFVASDPQAAGGIGWTVGHVLALVNLRSKVDVMVVDMEQQGIRLVETLHGER